MRFFSDKPSMQGEHFGSKFKWIFFDKVFLNEEFMLSLAAEFPKRNLERIHRSRGKKYSFETAQLFPDRGELTATWKAFAEDIRSHDFAEWIGQRLNVDLADCTATAALYRYGDGDSLSPHTDKPEKVASAIFYLPAMTWSPEYGGQLNILGSSAASDVLHVIPPQCGALFAFERNDHSWHSVSAAREPFRRQTLQIVFHRKRLAYSHNREPSI